MVFDCPTEGCPATHIVRFPIHTDVVVSIDVGEVNVADDAKA